MGTKVFSNERVTVIAGLASGISDWASPVLSELTALTNVSGAVNWNSFDLNVQTSDQKDDRTLTDSAGAQSRGPAKFGGTLELVNPLVTDTASIYRTAYDILSNTRVELVIGIRYGKQNSLAPAAGDKWTLFHVITDAVSYGANDVSRYYQVKLVPRDDILINYIAPASTPGTVTISALSATADVGDLVFVSAAYEGYDITKSATWVSSDESKLIPVHPGIFLAQAAGSPTVKAQIPGGTDSATTAITIS